MPRKHDALAYDAAHIWHPYSSITSPGPVRLVESAQGVRLRFADGTEVVDGMASWWCAIHGYRHPVLDAAVREQIDLMSHVMFGGLTHGPAISLAERLIQITPRSLDHVFFCDSGSVSVEVALKMALQARPGRGRVLTVRGGYYGDTLHPMSLCDPVNGLHSLFTGPLPRHVFAPLPPSGFDRPAGDPEIAAWAGDVAALLEEHSGQIAAILIEPVVQGAGGMRFYSPECVRVLRRLADQHDALLILDEIATGFGRTSTLFACQHADVTPDIMCVGKALTGGYLSLAATLCSGAVAEAVSESEAGVMMHGPTFMANPLACAVANAAVNLLLSSDWESRVSRIGELLSEGLAECADLPGVADVRALGAIGVVQLTEPVDLPAAIDAAVAHGVWLRPFRDLIYTMPPYVCGADEVRQITTAVRAAVTASYRSSSER
ncbi:MAG TPA: adenosylmethionine--8-amino-7-oxononanoate transaminase [Micromonosporaceae bacterium]|nr:adenosylmethionine--8-amino-7-oxononanoate transaminase [Micromonosporaceae bacterium]